MVKRYAVQYDGMIKIGIDGEDIEIEVDEGIGGQKGTITITIPEPYIISHEAPLSGTLEVIFDEAEHTENFSISEYANALDERKMESETDALNMGLFDDARESARSQIESLLKSIPDIVNNYTIIIN